MRPNKELPKNVTSLDDKRNERLGIPQPVDIDVERHERRQWPVMKRATAAWLIATAGVMTAIGIGQARENKSRDTLFNEKVAESTSEQARMTPQEAAQHGVEQANQQAQMQEAYDKAQNPDELTLNATTTEKNGSESAVNAPIEISATSIVKEAATNDKSLGQQTGELAGQGFKHDG